VPVINNFLLAFDAGFAIIKLSSGGSGKANHFHLSLPEKEIEAAFNGLWFVCNRLTRFINEGRYLKLTLPHVLAAGSISSLSLTGMGCASV
jgi:hypothetical protein